MTMRVARPADAATMLRTARLGLETYRAFAGFGWEPPVFAPEVIAEQLRARTTWALLADVAGEPAGHVAMARDRHRDDTALLWQLFIRPAWWGSGLAAALHDAFLEEARRRGYVAGRLQTPAAHARARRFYERRGWRSHGPPEPWLGMPVLEYRCAL